MKYILIIVSIMIVLNADYQYETTSDEINWDVVIEEYIYDSTKAMIEQLNLYYETSRELVLAVIDASVVYDVPIDIIVSLIFIESSFYQYAVSHKGALGYMQINPRVWQVDMDKIFCAYYNIDKGVSILRYYKNRSNSWESALIRYNGWVSGSQFGRNVLKIKEGIS